MPIAFWIIGVGLPVLAAVATYLFFESHERGQQPATAPQAKKKKPSTPRSPPTLPKGTAVLVGVATSAAIGLLTFAIVVAGYGMVLPHDSRWTGPLVASALVGAVATGYLFWEGLGAPDIPLGWKGVPLILRARSWVRFLLPEGKQWAIPYLFEFEPVDMRGMPLVSHPDNPEQEEIVIMDAMARLDPPDPTTPTGQSSRATKEVARILRIPLIVKIAARIALIDPFRAQDFDGIKDFLYAQLQEAARTFIQEHDAFDLLKPDKKRQLTKHLEDKLCQLALEMGVNFIKLAVTEIKLPAKINEATENVVVEWIQRASEVYNAETLGRAVEILRPLFPTLGDKELKNMVLTGARLATTQAYSFEGQGAVPVVPLTPGKGNTDKHEEHHD